MMDLNSGLYAVYRTFSKINYRFLGLHKILRFKFQPPVADVAIADLTVTSQRNADIDFTLPFMKLGQHKRSKILKLSASKSQPEPQHTHRLGIDKPCSLAARTVLTQF